MYIILSHESALEFWRQWRRQSGGKLPTFAVCNTWPDLCTLAANWHDAVSALSEIYELQQPSHLLLPTNTCVQSTRVRFHKWSYPLVDCPFYQVSNSVLVSSPLFTLLQLCSVPLSSKKWGAYYENDSKGINKGNACTKSSNPGFLQAACRLVTMDDLTNLHFVRLLLIAQELMGNYSLCCLGNQQLYDVESNKTTYNHKPLISFYDVQSLAKNGKHFHGIKRLRKLASYALENSYSPAETAIALGSILPENMGGFELPRPQLNTKLIVDDPKRNGKPQVFRPDILWPEHKLILEYDSNQFHSDTISPLNNNVEIRSNRSADDARANILTSKGFRVLHATRDQLIKFNDYMDLMHQIENAFHLPWAHMSREKIERAKRLHYTLIHPT